MEKGRTYLKSRGLIAVDLQRYWIFGAVLGIFVFIMSFHEAWVLDEIIYSYFIPLDSDADYDFERMSGLRDLIASQSNHYMNTNGRFAVHLIVQFFCGFAGRFWFALCNALVWGVLPWFVLRVAGRTHATLKAIFATVLLLLITFLPLPFTPAFQVNYVWTALASAAWLSIFLSGKRKSILFLFCFMILGMLAGGSNESFSFPLGGAIVIYSVVKRFRLTRTEWVGSVSFGIGAVSILCSPGFWNRVMTESGDVRESLLMVISRFMEILLPNSLIIILFVIVLCCKGLREKSRMSHSARTLIAAALCLNILLSVIMKLGGSGRILLAGDFFMIVLMLSVLREKAFFKVALTALVLVAIAMAALRFVENDRRRNLHNQIYELHFGSETGKVYVDDKEFARDAWNKLESYKLESRECKLLHPGQPELRVLPEALRNLADDCDTNMVVRLDQQAWILVQSKRNPEKFIVKKEILPGLLGRKMANRYLDPESGAEQLIDTTACWRAAIYVNSRPYIRAEVLSDSQKGEEK